MRLLVVSSFLGISRISNWVLEVTFELITGRRRNPFATLFKTSREIHDCLRLLFVLGSISESVWLISSSGCKFNSLLEGLSFSSLLGEEFNPFREGKEREFWLIWEGSSFCESIGELSSFRIGKLAFSFLGGNSARFLGGIFSGWFWGNTEGSIIWSWALSLFKGWIGGGSSGLSDWRDVGRGGIFSWWAGDSIV